MEIESFIKKAYPYIISIIYLLKILTTFRFNLLLFCFLFVLFAVVCVLQNFKDRCVEIVGNYYDSKFKLGS